MATRSFHAAFKTADVEAFAVLAFREEHRLGRPSEAKITVQLLDYVEPDAVIGAGAQLAYSVGDDGPVHRFAGIVDEVTVVGSTFVGGQSVHHVVFHVSSVIGLLAWNVGTQIFQEMTFKDVI